MASMRSWYIDFPAATDVLENALDGKHQPPLVIRAGEAPGEYSKRERDVIDHAAFLIRDLALEKDITFRAAQKQLFRGVRLPRASLREQLERMCLAQDEKRNKRLAIATFTFELYKKQQVEKAWSAFIWNHWPFRVGESRWVDTSDSVHVSVDTSMLVSHQGVSLQFDRHKVWHEKKPWSGTEYSWLFTVFPRFRRISVGSDRLVFMDPTTGHKVWFTQSRGMDLRRHDNF